MSATPIPPAPPVFERAEPAPDAAAPDRHAGANRHAGTDRHPGTDPNLHRQLGRHRDPDHDGPGGSAADHGAGLGRSRPARIGIALAVAGALVAGGTWLIGRDGATGEPSTAAPPTSPALFDPPATTVAVPGSDLPVEPEVEIVADGPLDAVVGLPARLDSLAPTELVVLTESRELIRVEVSTGVVESWLSRVPFGQPQLTATDNAVVVWSPGTDSSVVVDRRGNPTLRQTGLLAAVVASAVDDRFLLLPPAGSEAFELRASPEVASEPVVVDGVSEQWPVLAHPSGGWIVSTDDGSDIVLPGGRERLGDAAAFAAGRHHVLFKACDGLAPCRFIVDDPALGVETEIAAGPAALIQGAPLAHGLSPDGMSLVQILLPETGPVERIIDLQTGSAVETPIGTPLNPAFLLSWAPDSSGLFEVIDGAILFRDRATGQVTELTELSELLARAGGARAMAARPLPPPGPVVSTMDVAPGGPTGFDLVGWSDDGKVVQIDLDGSVVTAHAGHPLASGAPVTVDADNTGVSVLSWDNVDGFRLQFGESPEPIDGDRFLGYLFPGPVAGTLWRSGDGGFSDHVAFDLVDARGGELGWSIEVDNAYVLGSDGNGALLVDAGGGVYAAVPAGATRVTTGDLLASGPTTLYARECDEVLACQVVRVDRANGERTPVSHPAVVGAPGFQNPGVTGSSVSPDGGVVFVQAASNGLGWSIVDVVSGLSVEAPGPQDASSVVWSADSRFAVYLSGGRLRLYDRAAGSLTVLSDLPSLRGFTAVRPLPDQIVLPF